jgi:DNA-binding Lrp family transcriptional regulator
VSANVLYSLPGHPVTRCSGNETLQSFEQAVAALDEVVEARRVFGTPDYFLRVAVADHTEYERFQTHKLIGLPGIGRVVSYQTMKWIKMES